MFPIKDHNPSGRIPYVNYFFIAVNVIVFLLYSELLGGIAASAGGGPFGNMEMVPKEIMNGQDWHSIITSMFQHAGLMHLGGNMLFLWIFGDNMEDAMGHVGYFVFYLVCGVAAVAAHMLADPFSVVPVVGASGAVAGVMGGYLLLYPRAQVDIMLILVVYFKRFSLPAFVVLLIWFAMQLFGGFANTNTQGGGVAYWAHAGGFIAGILLTAPIWLRLGATKFWERNHGHPPHPELQVPQRYADRF